MIQDRYDQERGCGFRKEGGLYLIGGSLMSPCGKIPIPLTVCPCCNAGIKPTRGFTWVGSQLFEKAPCSAPSCRYCPPFDGSVERLGLLWIGRAFYKTPADFYKEAREQGISRRIPAIPKELIVGETWIALAHQDAIRNEAFVSKEQTPDEKPFIAGVISAFCPTAIEYVVKGDETDEEIEAMEKRGITCVRVHKKEAIQMEIQ